MKIIITVNHDDPGEQEEAREYVRALARTVERRQSQGLPGAILDNGSAQVWVSAVELAEDAS